MGGRRESIAPEGYPRPPFPYSPAVRFGPWVFVSGHLATDYQTGLPAEARLPYRAEGMAPQTRYVYGQLGNLLETAGSSLLHLVKADHYFLTRRLAEYSATRRRLITRDPPVGIAVEASRLLVPDALYSVEAVAVTRDSPPKESLTATGIPAPAAAYSQAVRWGDWVFAAGELATDFVHALAPEAEVDTRTWFREPIEVQTRYTLEKLRQIMEHCGSSLEDVVYARVVLVDPADIPGLERVWREVWPEHPPARSIMFCNGLASTEALVEIYPIGLVRGSRLPREVIHTPHAPTPLFHEPQALRVGDLLFLSTQLAVNEQGLDPSVPIDPRFPFFGNAAKRQMHLMLQHVQAICAAGGASLDTVLRTQLQFTDLAEFDAVREVWAERFGPEPPALSAAEVRGPFPVPGATVLMDVVAGVVD